MSPVFLMCLWTRHAQGFEPTVPRERTCCAGERVCSTRAAVHA